MHYDLVLQKFLLLLLMVSVFFTATAQNFNISLNANNVKDDTVYLDEPVLFTVTLSNQFAEYNLRYNREAQSYLDELKAQLSKGEIKQEYYDSEMARVKATMKKAEEVKVGSQGQPWAKQMEFVIVKVNGDTSRMPFPPFQYPETKAAVVLNENSYEQAAYGMENKLETGEYNITTRLRGATSDMVHLTVLPQKIPNDVMNSEAMLLQFGNYYSLLADSKKAIEYATKAISLFPNSVKAFLMHGDIYQHQEKWNEALADYETSLRLFYEQHPDSYEAPEYTLEMIEFLKEKIRKK